MIPFLSQLFDTNFMPHALCLRTPALIWLHAISDGLIAIAYFVIPVALFRLKQKRTDLVFQWMFLLFAAFILMCGATHALAVVTLWIPIYRFEGLVKLLTAIVSLATAFLMFRLIPQVAALPSPAQWQLAKEELNAHSQQLLTANLTLHQANAELLKVSTAAEAADRAKSIFLSTMSHEIRTPLSAILGYAQLMLRDPALGADSKANLEIIGRSGEHLLTLINAVLDMSKIESGHTEIDLVTFSLSNLLEDLASMFRLRAQAKALRFDMTVLGETVPYLLADEGKLRQVLINLLGNAVKFTISGQVKLQVHLDQRTPESLWLSATVEDSGQGLTAAEQKHLFEPFSQAKGGLNTQEGTGLGLAISRSFARLMGGDLTVVSTSGAGSQFQLEIPVQRGSAANALDRLRSRRVKGIRAGTPIPRILVVDDQVDNQDWLAKLLTAVGFSVRRANNGQTAIQVWEDWVPQLILMDIHMPVMDGLEATRRIKADARGKATAILVLTASALDEDRRLVSQSPADAFLSKPCRENDLLEKLRRMLNIDYDYEADSAVPDLIPLNAGALAQLPPGLAGELYNATAEGNKKLLDKLILQVRASAAASSATALQDLADHYDYDALTRLLGGLCPR
jgi:signal transduction histidine kinase/DNA-binding NarL/FixJ family response regulator